MLSGKKYLINSLIRGTDIQKEQGAIFLFLGILLLGLLIFSIATESIILWAFPIIVIFLLWTVQHTKGFLFLLHAMIPLSMEVELPGGFSTDLPDEPMMILMMGLILLMILRNHNVITARTIFHPITLLLLLHYFWIWTTTFTSQDLFPSIKYSLAKTWYITVFYFGPLLLFTYFRDFKRLITYMLIPLVLVTSYILVKHAFYNFSFEMANKVVYPFFRNHVNSSAIMVTFLPFVWMLTRLKKQTYTNRLLLMSTIPLLMSGIFFSYTRAAILSLFIGISVYFLVKKRWMKYALGIASVVTVMLLSSWIMNNKYLEFRPNFEHTVTHTEFGNLLSATYKLEDISTMERVYRWVAGYHMLMDRPAMGFGPSNFYNHYKSYTLHGFRTYVSDNPERSGVHSYYLMVAIEQGLVGFILFIVLCFFVILYGESLYHRLKEKDLKLLVMSAVVSFVIILSILIMNDMIETDKVGPFFFLSMAILVFAEGYDKSKKTQ